MIHSDSYLKQCKIQRETEKKKSFVSEQAALQVVETGQQWLGLSATS